MGKGKNRNHRKNKAENVSNADTAIGGSQKDLEVNWCLGESAEKDNHQTINGKNYKLTERSLKHNDSKFIKANFKYSDDNSLEGKVVQSSAEIATKIEDPISQSKNGKIANNVLMNDKISTLEVASEMKSKDQSSCNDYGIDPSSHKACGSLGNEFNKSEVIHGVKAKSGITFMNYPPELQDNKETNCTLNKENKSLRHETRKDNLALVPRKVSMNQTKRNCSSSFQTSFYRNVKNDSPQNMMSHTIPTLQNKRKSQWKNLKDDMFKTVNYYKKSKSIFSVIYNKWLKERKENLEKLHSLIQAIHDDQLNYNKAQIICRSAGQVSRSFKVGATTDTESFIAAFSALLSDAASGITSVAQAFNVESYKVSFQEIVDNDSKITKSLYDARSQCHKKYKDIEEIVRNYQANTLNSTVAIISNTLQVGKFWVAVKTANNNDDLQQALNVVGTFVGQACNPEVLGEVCNTVATYIDDNPAVLDACYAAGRAASGVVDSFVYKPSSKNILSKQLHIECNMNLIRADQREIARLTSNIDQNLPQTKLEEEIQSKIDSLENEMEKIISDYYQYLQDGISDEEGYSDDDE